MGPGHLIMPVNIQLSKISIASAISKTNPFCELLNLREQTQFPCKLLIWLVGPGGIEPPTSPLSGVRSSQLSYGPSGNLWHPLVELVGIEPATS